MGDKVALRLQRGGCNAHLCLSHKTKDIPCTPEGEREARASLAIRVDDLAQRAIALFPELPLNPDVLATNRAETLDDRRVRVKLGFLETGYEFVATNAHAAHLWTIQSEIEIALVGLCNTCRGPMSA